MPDYEHLKTTTNYCGNADNDGYLQLVGIMQKFIDQSICQHNYDPTRFPSGKVPMQQLLKDLLTAINLA
ncbi:Ribonucleoside-diphosphate reductase 1 subunit alpha [Yokenella regensburgei]|nr:Ribonucleoside-diphosphate reductase 1 subunit alpha [Yokenella regensburgei]